jgi:aminoglycoside/choline kinase family phosphotransferase
MIVYAPISVGELIDKITILKIKSKLITDANKLINVEKELQVLEELKDELNLNIDMIEPIEIQLYKINLELWHIENFKRAMEEEKAFGDGFVNAARQVYLKNDIRAKYKRQINELVGSTIVEEKSY